MLSKDGSHYDISVRALSPDNNRHIRDLISLFENNYQSGYPIKSVYEKEFWRSHIASRFISLACFKDGEIFAHLACQPDKHNPKVLQIAYTALNNSANGSTQIMGNLLWQAVESVSNRKGYNLIYNLDILPSPSAHFFQDILGTYETMICPGYYASATSGRDIRRPSLLVSQRFLERECFIEKENSLEGENLSGNIKLFVPQRHLEICKLLFAPLALSRTFVCEKQKKKSDTRNEKVLPADARAFEHAYYPKHALTHFTIQPSLVTKEFVRALRFVQPGTKTTLLCLNMHDSTCAALCDELEEYGYRFSGIAAGFQGRDNIVYTKSDEVSIEVNNFTCVRARKLAAYIESYGRSQNTAVLTKPFTDSSHGSLDSKLI